MPDRYARDEISKREVWKTRGDIMAEQDSKRSSPRKRNKPSGSKARPKAKRPAAKHDTPGRRAPSAPRAPFPAMPSVHERARHEPPADYSDDDEDRPAE